MIIYKSYFTDLGYAYHYVSLSFSADTSVNPLSEYAYEEITPQIIQEWRQILEKGKPCQLPTGIRPRRVELIGADRNSYKIDFPFPGYTTEFIELIDQLDASSLVASYKIRGEYIQYFKLSKLL